MSTNNPIAQIQAAEVVLAGQVRGVTELVRHVAVNGELAAATAELTAEIHAATERLREHRRLTYAGLAGLLGEVQGYAAEIAAGVEQAPWEAAQARVDGLALADKTDGPAGREVPIDEPAPPPQEDSGGSEEAPAAGAQEDSAGGGEAGPRVWSMVADLEAEGGLSNRELIRRHGGNSETAKQARRLYAARKATEVSR